MELPPSAGPVEQMFRDYHSLRTSLSPDAVTDLVALDTHFRKLLVLASASHLEDLMTFHMMDYFRSLGITPFEFIRRGALERKFFQWFDFESALPARFFKSFGKRCHEQYVATLATSEAFDTSCKSFLLLCNTRNNLIHTNLADATFELTPAEIEIHFRIAIEFPDLALRIVKDST